MPLARELDEMQYTAQRSPGRRLLHQEQVKHEVR